MLIDFGGLPYKSLVFKSIFRHFTTQLHTFRTRKTHLHTFISQFSEHHFGKSKHKPPTSKQHSDTFMIKFHHFRTIFRHFHNIIFPVSNTDTGLYAHNPPFSHTISANQNTNRPFYIYYIAFQNTYCPSFTLFAAVFMCFSGVYKVYLQ